MNRIWLRRALWAAAGIVVIGLLIWAFLPRPVEVEAATVARGPFEKTVDEDGKTRVRERYVVSAPLAGRLLRVELKAGDAVQPGTLLATLVPSAPTFLDARTERELAERVGAAEAEQLRTSAAVERATVALGQAKSDLARASKLAEQGFTSKQSLEHGQQEVEIKSKELKVAQFDAHAAEHQIALAKAALTRMRQEPGAAREQRWAIRSPVAGRVLRVAQESEAVVPVGAPILELGDPRNLEIVVDVLTSDASAIRSDQPAELDRGGGTRRLAGRVRLIEPAAFTKVSALGVEEQRVNVVIDLTSPPQEWQDLGDAFRVDARIVVERRSDAVTVPVSALFRHDHGWAVFVVHEGRARLRAIEIASRGGLQAAVERGLEPGETVIVYPGDAVSDGVRVKPRANQSRAR
jgi:HlyD family secretion protein